MSREGDGMGDVIRKAAAPAGEGSYKKAQKNERESIRQKLALGSFFDDGPGLYTSCSKSGKPSLSSRLQSGMNLQICFVNDSGSDKDSDADDSKTETSLDTPLSPMELDILGFECTLEEVDLEDITEDQINTIKACTSEDPGAGNCPALGRSSFDKRKCLQGIYRDLSAYRAELGNFSDHQVLAPLEEMMRDFPEWIWSWRAAGTPQNHREQEQEKKEQEQQQEQKQEQEQQQQDQQEQEKEQQEQEKEQDQQDQDHSPSSRGCDSALSSKPFRSAPSPSAG
ncbi:hypothetical protein WISP_22732 [Willisornis vidua]|uniref:Interleukin-12 subunit alpha n=1 Tax=Willisornis vidua TaxID=1566151 RepID=A0ABQ9DTB5_9PASS|nr:hypothetical protein WISP_22732 [Willisornis vidua]